MKAEKTKQYKVENTVKFETTENATSHREALLKSIKILPTDAKRIRSSVFGAGTGENETSVGVIDYDSSGFEAKERRCVSKIGKNNDYDLEFYSENGLVGKLTVSGSDAATENIIPQIAALWRDGTLSI